MGNFKTPVTSRPTLQPIAESCVASNSSLHNQTPEITNHEMQSSIKKINNILQQNYRPCPSSELIQQLKEALTTAAPSASPAPFVPPATEASRYATVAAKAIPILQPSRQQQRLPRFSRHQRGTPAVREAAARNFLPISETQGFSFVYLCLHGKEPVSTMRMRLCRLKLQSSRILDIHHFTNNIVFLLVHNAYYQEAIQILEMQQITCLPDFRSFFRTTLVRPSIQRQACFAWRIKGFQNKNKG
ncbi:unnamed protein product [Rhizopus stolonifer]